MADSAAKLTVDTSGLITKQERLDDKLPSSPRQRISIDTTMPYTLTSTWQNISFGQNSARDISTFPAPGRYDFNSLKFIASQDMAAEQQYYIHMYMKVTHKQRPVTVQFRYVVPAPTDIPFPFPDGDGLVTIFRAQKVFTGGLLGNLVAIGNLSLTEDTTVLTEHHTRTDLVPIGMNLRQYGIRMQMRTVETISTAANRPKLTDCYAFIIPA